MANENLSGRPEDRQENASQATDASADFEKYSETLKERDAARRLENQNTANQAFLEATNSSTENTSTPDNNGVIPNSLVDRAKNNRASRSKDNESSNWDAIINGDSEESYENSDDNSEANDRRFEQMDYWDELAHRGESKSHARQREADESKPLFQDMLEEEGAVSDYMQDPTDFTDVAAEQKKNRILKIALTSTATILALAIGGYFGIQAFMTNPENNDDSSSAPIEVIDEGAVQSINPGEPKRPLLEKFSSAPSVGDGLSTATAEGSTITTSEGFALTVSGAKLNPTQTECAAVKSTDFCLAARGTTATMPATDTKVETVSTEVDVYHFKDAAHSRIFENPSEYKELEVPGASASAVMKVALVGGQPTPVIVVVNSDSSGFMVALPSITSIDEAAAIAGQLQHSIL